MEVVATNMTVGDFCTSMKRGEIVINREYQRSDKVWPLPARSYLIETILLRLPMPKFSLHQITDLKSKKIYKEIVDGQQRSSAIRDFFEGNLTLSNQLDSEDLAGKSYSQLADDLQQRFLDYPLTIDLFVGATPEQVREIFRRINSYNVPLNPEEQRHAVYQGKFKWFIHTLARRFDKNFENMGIFTQKQLVRMADTKLLTEICHAILMGIRTTNRAALDAVYEANEEKFPDQKMLDSSISDAMDTLLRWPQIHQSAMMRPHLIYSLILAVIHVKRAIPTLETLFESPKVRTIDTRLAVENLSALAAALEGVDTRAKFKKFIAASSEKTNVKSQRATRFTWFCRALTQKI